MNRVALILWDAKPNRHSLNALVGALETDRELDDLPLRLAANEEQLRRHVAEALAAGIKPVVAVSFTTQQLPQVRQLRERASLPNAVWLAGGPHPTADPEGTLQLGFDVVVRGEGETTLPALLRALSAGDDWQEVPGIVYRTSIGAAFTPDCRSPVDLDVFPPFPLRRRRVVGPIEITRGCPFACGYCQTSHLLGLQPRHRGIETIARYAAVIRQRGLRDVRVITPNAFSYGSPDGRSLKLSMLEALLVALRQTLGDEGRLFFGTFPSEVRPEHVNDDTLQLVKRYANNQSLIIGAQSGSDRMLGLCGRGHRAAEILSAVAQTVAAGLRPHVDFIFGLPGETEDDQAQTVEVIRELIARGALIHAHTFTPLPQTAFAGQPSGRIADRLRPILRDLIRQGVLYGIPAS